MLQSNWAAADTSFRRAPDLEPGNAVALRRAAEAHAFRGELDPAFEWLERAYNQRDGGVTEIKGDRLMRGLVSDPRYKAFLRKLKLPE